MVDCFGELMAFVVPVAVVMVVEVAAPGCVEVLGVLAVGGTVVAGVVADDDVAYVVVAVHGWLIDQGQHGRLGMFDFLEANGGDN